MTTGTTILWVIGILAAFEGFLLLLFPKWALNLCKKMSKWKVAKMRDIALIEFIIGAIIILLLIFL